MIHHEEDSENSYASDSHDEHDDDNYDECFGNSSSDEGSIESTFEDWIKRKKKWKEKCKSISD